MSFILTILLNIVIGVIVPTPGRHLKCPEKLPTASNHHYWSNKTDETHRDHSGVIGQKVTWSDMACLVFCAPNIQCQLNRTLRTKVIAGTVLWVDQREASECYLMVAVDHLATTDTYPRILQFVYNVITGEGYETWKRRISLDQWMKL